MRDHDFERDITYVVQYETVVAHTCEVTVTFAEDVRAESTAAAVAAKIRDGEISEHVSDVEPTYRVTGWGEKR